RGMALAVPVLAGFGALLVAADAGFERLVYGVFAIDPLGIPGHVLWLVGLGWLAGGFLYGVLVLRRAHPEAAVLRGVRLGIVEAGVVIGSLNLLLGVFVVVQLPYLFGGHGVVLATEGLTLASYARRGFFELAGVAALALPLLLGLRRLLASERGHALRWYNALACAQVGLLVLVLASAAQRMLLYQEVYGLTTLRLYVSACIGWLAVVLLWFAATVLCGRVGRFVPGAVAAGLVLVGSLYALNPDALIVRVNAARAAEGHPFDLAYATGRSADAVPALLDVLDALPPAARAEVAAGLLRRWHEAEPPSWRTWNRSRLLARRAVAAEADRLFALVGARPGAQEASMHVAAGVDVDGGAGGMVGEAAGEQDH
ncbi:MAG: DUF4173 domain-containing protein, partial [Rhodothermales bacterium]|nr:DUF4173 domain-containing protein [Rhodothermales bacterium]